MSSLIIESFDVGSVTKYSTGVGKDRLFHTLGSKANSCIIVLLIVKKALNKLYCI